MHCFKSSLFVLASLFTFAAYSAGDKASIPSPTGELSIHLVGVHPEKDNPLHQSLVHHYCRQMDPDLAQCALYDGDKQDSNLMGIEYIVSGKTYDSLPVTEKKYWHPHNFEILSGMLNAPDFPADVEKNALKGKMNSYGKTWHVWRTRNCCNGNKLPLGAPSLMWSLNHDGEATPLVQQKLKDSGIDVAAKRKDRADLASFAEPQGGVEALTKDYPKGMLKPMEGIVEKK